jgi:hypothetical protein
VRHLSDQPRASYAPDVPPRCHRQPGPASQGGSHPGERLLRQANRSGQAYGDRPSPRTDPDDSERLTSIYGQKVGGSSPSERANIAVGELAEPASLLTTPASSGRRLLNSLREVGADRQVATLRTRLPSAGMFHLEGVSPQFRFGREVNGTPARPWGWADLD